jgi:hypothetical protein
VIPYTVSELADRLTMAARKPGRKVLFCGPGVAEALALIVPEAPPVPPARRSVQPDLALLTGVEITPGPDLADGEFALVLHSGCHVNISTYEVTHGQCPVVADGVVTGI